MGVKYTDHALNEQQNGISLLVLHTVTVYSTHCRYIVCIANLLL